MARMKRVILCDGRKFVSDLMHISGKNATQLDAEAGFGHSYLSSVKRSGECSELGFHYFCNKYGLNEEDYIANAKQTTPVQKDGLEDVLIPIQQTIYSINSTLFEINRTLKAIDDHLQMFDTNASSDTREILKQIESLYESING